MANKTFFTYDEQIEKLEKEKQLVISIYTDKTGICLSPD